MNIKEYVRHAEKCDREYRSNCFVELEYSFKPKSSEIFSRDVFNQTIVKIGKCQKLNHIIVPDMFASTLHGEIRKNRKGWIYEDTSVAGTQINKKTIVGKAIPINVEDILRAYPVRQLNAM